MSNSRKGGIIQVKVNGKVYDAKGDYEYSPGYPVRSPIKGTDGKVHGYTEEAGEPMISGKITDARTLSLKELQTMEDATVVIELSNGKSFMLSEAFYADEGVVNTKEGEVPFKFIGKRGEEI